MRIALAVPVALGLSLVLARAAASQPLAAPVPDFSDIWVHPTLPGFELPLSGPGPVTNRSRRPDGASDLLQLVGDYTNPILKPQTAEVVKRAGEIALRGEGYPTPRNPCWP